MVIYEVNLSIDEEIYEQFKSWLKSHVKEMLQFPGFIKAQILRKCLYSNIKMIVAFGARMRPEL